MNTRTKRILTRVSDRSFRCGWLMKTMLVISALMALWMLFYNVAVLFFRDTFVAWIQSPDFPSAVYFYRENLLFFFTGVRMMYLLCTIVGVVILLGCTLMWSGRLWGLLLFVLGKVLQIYIPYMFMGYRMLAIGDIMLSLLFIVFYAVNCFTHRLRTEERKYYRVGAEDKAETPAAEEENNG